MITDNQIVVIGGATATGKSDLAIQLSEKLDGEIINSDSMQIYRDIPILSSQPYLPDLLIPHYLYGFLEATVHFSVGKFVELASLQIKQTRQLGKIPIIVGGTGLYLKALIDGLSYIPDITPEIRQQVQELWQTHNENEFYQKLILLDPLIENKIRPTDNYRLTRAMEVFIQTGQSIIEWRNSAEPIFNPDSFKIVTLNPPREIIYRNINQRFYHMLEQGAVEEVKAFRQLQLSADLPINKAIGIRELSSYLDGEISIEQAVELAQTATRHYAKRQMTWFRNQFKQAISIDYLDVEKVCMALSL